MSEAEKELLRKMIRAALKEFPHVVSRQRMRAVEADKRKQAFGPVVSALVRNGIESRHHEWRRCPPGHHWVREHDRKIKSGVTSVDGHCRVNRGRKDELSDDEIKWIANQVHVNPEWMPTANRLGFSGGKKFDGNKYDRSIALWTKYWNDVFRPDVLLEPDFIKALMASESGFNPDPSKTKRGRNPAFGLMQLTRQTCKVLRNIRGELNNHLIFTDEKSLLDPDVNISSAIRWLFYKRELASKRLGRSATWKESLLEYKGYLRKPKPVSSSGKESEHVGIAKFADFYEMLKTAKRKKQ